MSGQSQKIGDLLRQRLHIVQELSAANAEHHRLLQVSGGADFLSLLSATDLEEVDDQRPATPDLEANATRLSELEAELEQVDKLLEETKTKGKHHE